MEYSYKPKNLWQWLIGKESLIITVYVTEEGSGVDEIIYTITPESETLTAKGETLQMTVIVTPDSATDKSIIWSSDNP